MKQLKAMMKRIDPKVWTTTVNIETTISKTYNNNKHNA